MKLPSIALVLPTRPPDARGLLPIMIRVIYQRKILHKSTGLKVAPALFSPDKLIHNSVPNAAFKNRQMRNKLADLELAFMKLEEAGHLTLESVRQTLSGDGTPGLVAKVIQQVIDKHEDILKHNYIKGWKSVKTKIDGFKPGMLLSELTPATLKDFEQYMRRKLGNDHNTVAGTLRRLATIMTKATELHLIASNPLSAYTPPNYKQTLRHYLTEEEVEKIAEFSNETKNSYLQVVSRWFVLGCYSGLRYSDLVNWDEDRMVRNGRLYFSDEKTDNPHYIPIYPQLQEAIEGVQGLRSIPENQPYNRALKEIAGLTEITVKLTSHVARHSFAVMYLDKGGSIEVLQKLMGHKKIATTQIYGQITSKRIDEEADKVFKKRR